jgi:predicted  nucleic acid-binding Zn-ribbon protein
MGSQAQDSRHAQILQNRRNEVTKIEHQVSAKENELQELREKLEEAKCALRIQEHIDLTRD